MPLDRILGDLSIHEVRHTCSAQDKVYYMVNVLGIKAFRQTLLSIYIFSTTHYCKHLKQLYIIRMQQPLPLLLACHVWNKIGHITLITMDFLLNKTECLFNVYQIYYICIYIHLFNCDRRDYWVYEVVSAEESEVCYNGCIVICYFSLCITVYNYLWLLKRA